MKRKKKTRMEMERIVVRFSRPSEIVTKMEKLESQNNQKRRMRRKRMKRKKKKTRKEVENPVFVFFIHSETA